MHGACRHGCHKQERAQAGGGGAWRRCGGRRARERWCNVLCISNMSYAATSSRPVESTMPPSRNPQSHPGVFQTRLSPDETVATPVLPGRPGCLSIVLAVPDEHHSSPRRAARKSLWLVPLLRGPTRPASASCLLRAASSGALRIPLPTTLPDSTFQMVFQLDPGLCCRNRLAARPCGCA